MPWEDPSRAVVARFIATLRLSLTPTQLVANLGREQSWVRGLTFILTLSLVFSPLHVAVDLILKPQYRSGWLGLAAANFMNDPVFVALDVVLWSLATIAGAAIAGVRVPASITLRGCAYTIWPWFVVRILFHGPQAQYADLPLYVLAMLVLTALSSHHGIMRTGERAVNLNRALLAGLPLPAIGFALKIARIWAA